MASVERTKYGTWRARWKDDAGKQHARSFRLKADARTFLDKTLGDMHRGEIVTADAGKITVRGWADLWLAGARNLGRGGQDTYRRDLDRYILPELGDIELRHLTAETIDVYLTAALERPLAPSTVHRHYRTIRRMCQVAVERKRLPSNPCGPVTPPTVHHAEMRFLTMADVEALAGKISARYRAWVYLATYGGLRWSESIGLQRKAIDGNRVTVTSQLVRRADNLWYRDPPKTRAGIRTLVVPKFVAEELAVHVDRFALAGADGLVFPNQNGSPLIAQSFTGNVFKPALERAGLDRAVRIHDLRHTAVAFAIRAHAHPKAIQARMGHASISVTLDRYGHLFPEMDEELAGDLGVLRAEIAAGD